MKYALIMYFFMGGSSTIIFNDKTQCDIAGANYQIQMGRDNMAYQCVQVEENND